MSLFDKWFGNKSFLVKVVDKENAEQTESYSIDVEKVARLTVEGGIVLMGVYFGLSTARQILVGHFAVSGGGAALAPVFNNTVSPVIAPVMNNTVNNVGHLTKIVKRLNEDGTKEIWETVGDAAFDLAKEKGITYDRARWLISRTINGHKPDSFKLMYETLAPSTTG